MADQAHFYYADEVTFDEKAAKKFLKGNVFEPLKTLKSSLEETDDYSDANLETIFTALLESFEIKLGKIAQPVRVALTGTSVSPGIFEVISVLGKQRVIPRLEKAIQFIENRMAAAK